MQNETAAEIARGQWSEAVHPIAVKFEIAAQFGGNAVFTPDGAKACGQLLREMARLMDSHKCSDQCAILEAKP